jgi:hypothetical protein
MMMILLKIDEAAVASTTIIAEAVVTSAGRG